MNPFASPRAFPFVVLGVAALVRIVLCAQGGQYFWFDEARHERAVWIYTAALHGDFSPLRTVAAFPDHTLFPWLGTLVTAGQHLLAQFTPHADWRRPEAVAATAWLGAALLSLASTAVLALTHRLARRAGASVVHANLALLLLAASTTALAHARFLLPYDAALAALLGALCLGLPARSAATHSPDSGPPVFPSPVRAAAAALCLGLTYHLYNGYWFTLPVAAGLLAWSWRPAPRFPALLATAALVGAVTLAAPVAVGVALSGDAYLAALAAFSRSVTQGAFAEGASLPFAYAWDAEGVLALLVAAFVLLAVVLGLRAPAAVPPVVRGALLAAVVGYALLVLLSVGLHRLVVYARTLKPLAPALALAAAWPLARLLATRPRLAWPVAAWLACIAAVNAAPFFAHVFPRDIEAAVLRAHGRPKRTLTVAGSLYFPSDRPVARPDLALVNAQNLYPVRALLPPPAGRTLLRVDHPLAYRPFHYEGFAPAERALLRSADLSIRLVQLADPAAVPDDLPPAHRYAP